MKLQSLISDGHRGGNLAKTVSDQRAHLALRRSNSNFKEWKAGFDLFNVWINDLESNKEVKHPMSSYTVRGQNSTDLSGIKSQYFSWTLCYVHSSLYSDYLINLSTSTADYLFPAGRTLQVLYVISLNKTEGFWKSTHEGGQQAPVQRTTSILDNAVLETRS